MLQGAIREIRKDTAFLAKEKLKETLQRYFETFVHMYIIRNRVYCCNNSFVYVQRC